MKKLSTWLLALTIPLLVPVSSCTKTETGPGQPAAPVTGPMGAIGLKAGEVVLHSLTPELQMAPTENVQLAISQLTADTTKTTPVGLQYASSNSQVATISVTGRVVAVGTGSAVLTATDGNNKRIFLPVMVQAPQNLPALTEPVFLGFAKPFLVINKEKNQALVPRVLNRLGQVLPVPCTLTFHSGGTEKTITSNLPANYPPDGLYELSGKAANKGLRGSGRAVLVTPTNSTLAGAKAGMFNVTLMRVPEYFNKNGLTSEPVHGLVWRLLPGLDQGKVFLMVNTAYEDVLVKTDKDEVLTAASTKLVSVKAGLARWRVEQENFIGRWQCAQVLFDFSGGWICANNKRGSTIQLSVPAIAPQVLHVGSMISQPDIYSSWFKPLNKAKTLYKDNVTLRLSPISDATLGPINSFNSAALVAELLRPGAAYGELDLEYDRVRGTINYVSDDEFTLSDGTLNGPVFRRGTVNVTTSGPTAVTTRAAVLQSTLQVLLQATSTGAPQLSRRGFCFSTRPNPDVTTPSSNDGGVTNGSLTDPDFSTSLPLFNQSTTYYVRAYATATTGAVTYGNQVSFASGLLCDVAPKLLHENSNRITPGTGSSPYANIDVTSNYVFRPRGCYYTVNARIIDTNSPGRVDYMYLTFGERPQAGRTYTVIPYSQFGFVPASNEVELSLSDSSLYLSGGTGETLTIGGSPTGNFTVTGTNIRLTNSRSPAFINTTFLLTSR